MTVAFNGPWGRPPGVGGTGPLESGGSPAPLTGVPRGSWNHYNEYTGKSGSGVRDALFTLFVVTPLVAISGFLCSIFNSLWSASHAHPLPTAPIFTSLAGLALLLIGLARRIFPRWLRIVEMRLRRTFLVLDLLRAGWLVLNFILFSFALPTVVPEVVNALPLPLRPAVPVPSGTKVYLADGGFAGAAKYQPTDAILSRDSSFLLRGMSWSRWTKTSAVGTGIGDINTCNPMCAAGNRMQIPIKVSLSAPVFVCGNWFFTSLKYEWPDGVTGDDEQGQDETITPTCN